MTPYDVRILPEAYARIDSLYDYIAAESSPERARRYIDALIAYCQDLRSFPNRGNRRDDLYPGLRITHFRGRVAIAFFVDDQDRWVAIHGLFYGGQNYDVAFNR